MKTETKDEVNVPTVSKSTDNILKVNYHNLKKSSLVLRAINHKLRQPIRSLIEN